MPESTYVRIVWEVDDFRGSTKRTLRVPRDEWEMLSADERDEYVHDHAVRQITIVWEVSDG